MAEESRLCGGRVRATARRDDHATSRPVAGRAGKGLRQRWQCHYGGGGVEEAGGQRGAEEPGRVVWFVCGLVQRPEADLYIRKHPRIGQSASTCETIKGP